MKRDWWVFVVAVLALALLVWASCHVLVGAP